MSLRIAIPALLLLGSLTAACTGAPAEGEGIVTITRPTPPPRVIPALVPGPIVSESGSFALMAATNVAFSLAPQGGTAPYVISWNFGDGTAPLVGPAATHVFANTGNFNVVATVTDAAGKTEVSNPVVVRSRNVSGRWHLEFAGPRPGDQDMDVVQNGAALVASIKTTGAGLGAGTGAVSNARQMSATLTFAELTPNAFTVTLVGSVSPDLQTWTGTATGYDACPCNFTGRRSLPPAEPLVAAPIGTN